MGFSDLYTHEGLDELNTWLANRSFIDGYWMTQADAAVCRQLIDPPDAVKYPHARRWFNTADSHFPVFYKLPGDPAKPYTAYGPGAAEAEANRLAEDRKRRAARPSATAKSKLLLEVIPWEEEVDLALMEGAVRSIERDGLAWGTSEFLPARHGKKKLHINLVVEDETVNLAELERDIQLFENYVKQTDILTTKKL
ncbi:Translation elongation factor EF1B/ribosomal protein S6 [Cordyceps fumosorosea ARSEF 2679]|uniref:Translation elongation factor EF1B/ribosomal protein S6 n=1 Tax=Cordyceps fumosorosea (strain ARSEF 2679) TaxID=1081104 RepID=A0A167R006_CORFA|nr:Translation elongation factor EF1B/ribosomal protein S6 [Cordyceps fumosorosea ARSEF 2679]OAA58144.1 Translation elongation factor EF1B/ribosomal protein S6 [Cordyceps fumosorosea ARSEF 2679]